MRLTSFPPIINAQAKVLILGSMPGQRSLAQNQYYAHPRNGFWPLMGQLCGAGPGLPYAERVTRLQRAGIALWDVLQHCERAGSLDASIVAASEVPNDFPALLSAHPLLRAVCFNGRKAEQAFARWVLPALGAAMRQRLDLILLPSTSPANTQLNGAAKLAAWQVILSYLAADSHS